MIPCYLTRQISTCRCSINLEFPRQYLIFTGELQYRYDFYVLRHVVSEETREKTLKLDEMILRQSFLRSYILFCKYVTQTKVTIRFFVDKWCAYKYLPTHVYIGTT